MGKFYYADEKNFHGPFTIDQLKKILSIQCDTMIWDISLSLWKRADEFGELKEIVLKKVPAKVGTDKFDFEGVPGEMNKKPATASRPIENEGMFSDLFSFDGRARRTEYGLSLIIYCGATFAVNYLTPNDYWIAALVWHFYLIYFIWAQGAKRCHDLGKNLIHQFIPFYVFWMLFAEGEKGDNYYGKDPKR